MSIFEGLFGVMTSLALVYLTIESTLGMTLSEDQRDVSTMMAPSGDQLESTSQMSVTQAAGSRTTESREVREHINLPFTYAGPQSPREQGRGGPPTPPPVVPRCATERGFCTETEAAVTDDFSDVVNQLLGSNPEFWKRFNTTDVLTQEDQTIIKRGSDDPDKNHLCGSKVENKRVTWATNEDNVVMRIAQSKDFVQVVRLEHCTNEDCRCHEMFTYGLPRHYTARCRQKYVYRTFLALSDDAKKNTKLIPQNFQLPSFCSCVITKELNFEDGGKCGLVTRISPTDDSNYSPPD